MDGDLRRCDRPMNVSWPRILEALAAPTPPALQSHSERLHVALAALSARCRRRVSIPACTGPMPVKLRFRTASSGEALIRSADCWQKGH